MGPVYTSPVSVSSGFAREQVFEHLLTFDHFADIGQSKPAYQRILNTPRIANGKVDKL